MLRILLMVLYTGFILGANTAAADVTAAKAVLGGEMRKLQLHDAPVALPEIGLVDLTDAERGLSEWKGKWVVVNFWATWCAPCRKEMPGLARLSASDGAPVVVTVATGRNPPEAISRFLGEIGVTDLPVLRDPKSELARGMGVLGLPLTVVLNPDGQEVARLIGDAEWDGAEAKAALTALMAE